MPRVLPHSSESLPERFQPLECTSAAKDEVVKMSSQYFGQQRTRTTQSGPTFISACDSQQEITTIIASQRSETLQETLRFCFTKRRLFGRQNTCITDAQKKHRRKAALECGSYLSCLLVFTIHHAVTLSGRVAVTSTVTENTDSNTPKEHHRSELCMSLRLWWDQRKF